MARAPLLQLTDISLGFGGNPVFSDLSLVVQEGDRLALVGRNGSGKSTLMKVMAGLVLPDTGRVVTPDGVRVGYMEQDPDFAGFATLGDFATATLDPAEAWRVEAAAEGLKLRLDAEPGRASGGERRRAALARLLAEAPELMLLDEPTNHLDIEAIGWLERNLLETRAGFVLISHDRAFLTALARGTLWLDRGVVRRQDQGFGAFEAWRERTWEEEDAARHKLDRKIKAEARWAVEGISARRKRNQGRVRALQALREERASQIRRQGTADMALEAGSQSGKRVIEARGISKVYNGQTILEPFDLRVLRGDRIAFVGPNGAGKTTLLNMLTGQLQPDTGEVTLGTGIEMAVFDQTRAQLDPEATLWDSLTMIPRTGSAARRIRCWCGVSPSMWWVTSRISCSTRRRRARRSSRLSGGEKARLLLARIMARSSNLLVLDEPTNDLDIETLDLYKICWGNIPARCCWSATTAISSTGWRASPSRWKGGAAQRSMPAAGAIWPPRGGRLTRWPRRKPARGAAPAPAGQAQGAEHKIRPVLYRDASVEGAARRDCAARGGDREAWRIALRPGAFQPRTGEVPQGDRGDGGAAGEAFCGGGRMAFS
jgi:ABC transport system ATP-binding/permease protein